MYEFFVCVLMIMFYYKFIYRTIYICIGVFHSLGYPDLETELQNRLPEYRVSSGSYRRSSLNGLFIISLILCLIPSFFTRGYQIIWIYLKSLPRNAALILTVGLPAILILSITEILDFEVTFEGNIIFSSQFPEGTPTVSQLVQIIKNEDIRLNLHRLIFIPIVLIIGVCLSARSKPERRSAIMHPNMGKPNHRRRRRQNRNLI
ncbi:uncharacterized protein LOC108050415 [Drosophila rhopaloa]|uniref:Uncharacterized protein LOC108050415 n=1 Tax=Drosophila rhopaloa TaxID=1041015 RepID=A0A6P4FQS8_DRORH|nr:uncharacterized protein LOC108050415 [Drosophila rhopaloa]